MQRIPRLSSVATRPCCRLVVVYVCVYVLCYLVACYVFDVIVIVGLCVVDVCLRCLPAPVADCNA